MEEIAFQESGICCSSFSILSGSFHRKRGDSGYKWRMEGLTFSRNLVAGFQGIIKRTTETTTVYINAKVNEY